MAGRHHSISGYDRRTFRGSELARQIGISRRHQRWPHRISSGGVNVYVESNFVLELALLQEQSTSCEGILELCEASRVRLIVPAYSLTEPYETLTRRHQQRRSMKEDLDNEFRLIARTAPLSERLRGFKDLTALLISVAQQETQRLENVRSRLLEAAEIIPLDTPVLAASNQYQRAHDLSPQDALVYSSVLSHLKRVPAPQSCFLNRNSKDFDDQNIVDELAGYNCKLLPRFDSGYSFISAALG